MKKIKIISIIFLIISFINVYSFIKNNFKKITKKFDPKIYEEKYNKSQYVIPNSKNPISDSDLYSYIGYKYIKGQNPLYLNAEHLTIGKYLIGLSIKLTNNQNFLTLILILIIFLIGFFFVKKLTGSLFLSSILLIFFSMDSFFKDMIINGPLLDIFQLFFLLISFLLFIDWYKNKKNNKLVFTGINLGLFATSKFYLTLLPVLLTIFLFLIFQKESLKKIIFYMTFLITIIFITFISTYIVSFYKGTNIQEFVKSQKWIFNFWRFNSLNQVDAKGNFLKLVLFNKWKIWWNNKNYINYQYWDISWPLFYITGLIIAIYNFKNYLFNFINQSKIEKENESIKLNFYIKLFSIWIINYSFYLIFIPIYPRYLILIYPFIYLLIILFFAKIIKSSKYV